MSKSRRVPSARPVLRIALAVALATSILVLLSLTLAGCGGDPGERVLAKVGDRDITAQYYEQMLGKMRPNDLPVDDDGLPVDTASHAGKMAFLNVLVNKELMALKAADLGFDKDEKAVGMYNVVTEYEAGTLMHEELINAPCQEVTLDEVLDYYADMGISRNFQFIICNFEDDAIEAREKVLSGLMWEDVAEEYNDGSRGPNGDFRVSIKYGQVDDDFEAAIFGIKEGEVTMPIHSVYGWWILRFNNITEESKPPLDATLLRKIHQTLVGRCVNLQRTAFVEASREKHELTFDETALWIVFQGMPENEPYLDEVTRKPVPKESLADLEVPLEELDRVFYSVRFKLDEELDVWTIGDYKEFYDDMNTFQRPKRAEMLGGVRQKILSEMIDRQLLVSEAYERGFDGRPEVTGVSKSRSEQVMVSKLHDEVIQFEEHISAEELDAFWTEHQAEYMVAETRTGHVVYCADRESADTAYQAAVGGRPWDAILAAHGSNRENKDGGGEISFTAGQPGLLRDKLFLLDAAGDVAEPFPAQDKWAVVRLEEISEAHQQELSEVRSEVGRRMKMIRKDEALRNLLEEWKAQYGLEIHEDALTELKSLQELTTTTTQTDLEILIADWVQEIEARGLVKK